MACDYQPLNERTDDFAGSKYYDDGVAKLRNGEALRRDDPVHRVASKINPVGWLTTCFDWFGDVLGLANDRGITDVYLNSP